MYNRKLARALIVTTPVLLPLTALAKPGDGTSVSSRNVPVQSSPAQANSTSGGAVTLNHAVLIPNTTANAVKTKPLHIAGRVSAPDNKPVPDAFVYVAWQQKNGQAGLHKIVCNSSGRFDDTFTIAGDINNQTLEIMAFSPGKKLCCQTVYVDNSQLAALDLALQPGITLEGHLVQQDGRPLAGAEVHLSSLQPFALALFNQFPAEALAALGHATTDARGRFLLAGVPRQARLTLATGEPLTLTEGSLRSITTTGVVHQEAGIFVASPVGSVKVRVVDAQTGKPLCGMQVGASSQVFFTHTKMAVPVTTANGVTDANGEILFSSVRPGDCQIYVQRNGTSAQAKIVQVKPGGAAASAEIRIRQGALQGTLTDAGGKPVAHAQITILNSDANSEQAITNTAVLLTDQFFTANMGLVRRTGEVTQQVSGSLPFQQIEGQGQQVEGQGQPLQAESQPQIQINSNNTTFFVRQSFLGQMAGVTQINLVTDANGNFEVNKNFPWTMKNLRIRAVQGNAMAEWRGTGAELGSSLKLQLRPNALVSVSGRLIDPQRRPLANAACQALHWQPTPRSTWFATARSIRTDANGEFTVNGLERGESFSIITTGQNGQTTTRSSFAAVNGPVGPVGAAPASVNQAVTSLALPLASGVSATIVTHDFESPRFQTCRAGDVQNVQRLGDVMVHPSESSEEVLQSYGGESPGDQPELPGVIVMPSGSALQAAQAALARWESAVKTGDVNTIQQLTAHVSSCWSPDKQAFLQHASLCGAAEPTDPTSKDTAPKGTESYALRFVPRATITALLQAAPAAVRTTLSELHGGDEGLAHNADWAFLIRPQGNTVRLAGVLHQEEGAWHVVIDPAQIALSALPNSAGSGTLNTSLFTRAATPLDANAQAEAMAAGTQYLQTWRAGDKQKLRLLTSPTAPFIGSNLDQFHQKLEKRADGGVCPLASDEKIALQPVTDLMAWEQPWLEHVAGAGRNLPTLQVMVRSVTTTHALEFNDTPLVQKPAPTAGRTSPALAALHYTAQGHDFLMLLRQNNAKWEIVEPALPM